MKTSNLLLLVALAFILLASTVFVGYTKTQMNRVCIEADGPVIEKEIVLSGFNGISVSNKVKVVLTQQSQQKVTVRAEENLMDHIIIEVHDNTLTIGCKTCIENLDNVSVAVSIDSIRKIEVQSAAELRTVGLFSGTSLEINIESAGNLEAELAFSKLNTTISSGAEARLKGKVETSKIDISSAGQFHAFELKSIESSVDASSGAGVSVNASQKIRVDASSGAQVSYIGNPETHDINSSSGGSVTKVN